MSNYKESTAQGTVYTRCFGGSFDNTYGKDPSMLFAEEIKAIVGDKITSEVQPNPLRAVLNADTAAKMVNLIHPETGQVIGQASYQEIFIAVRSIWVQLAKERDEALQALQDLKSFPIEETGAGG